MTTVLIADDEQNMARLVQMLMEREGYRVLVAHDGGEAMALMEAETPGIVLLDVAMPVMDGYEVLRRMKADERLRAVPVVMLSARKQDADLMHGIEAGASSYVTKPFNPQEIMAICRDLLGATGDSGAR